MNVKRGVVLFVGLVMSILLSSVLVSAEAYEPPMPMNFIWSAVIIVAILTILVVIPATNRFAQRHKQIFFLLFALPVVLSSLYLGVHTIYENTVSVTKGPVHWHAEYGVYVCDEQLDLIDPKGLRNKIGTPVLHEHDDHWIHVEGTVMDYTDVYLSTYFDVIDGELTRTSLRYVTNDGVVEVANGDTCPDGSVGELNVYVNGDRIDDPETYVLAPEIFVPNGDCIIIDFSADQGMQTEKECISWAAKGYTYDDYRKGRRFDT